MKRTVTNMCVTVGSQGPRKNSGSHIDASHSRQPLVKGERLVRYEVNAVMPPLTSLQKTSSVPAERQCVATRFLANTSCKGALPTCCYPRGCAAPGQVPCQCNTRGSLSKLKRTPPQTKINVTSKSPVGDISVVTLIRTDTTLDHSQKAEKV